FFQNSLYEFFFPGQSRTGDNEYFVCSQLFGNLLLLYALHSWICYDPNIVEMRCLYVKLCLILRLLIKPDPVEKSRWAVGIHELVSTIRLHDDHVIGSFNDAHPA